MFSRPYFPAPARVLARLGRPLAALLLAVTGLIAACGGGRSSAPTEPVRGPLQASRSTVVDAAECRRGPSNMRSLLAYREVDGECRRSFTGFDAQLAIGQARRQATATAPAVGAPRVPTPAELFDWAETVYPQYFNSHESNRQFANYTYRFYPGTLNHAAVEGQRVYVQGPLSNGALWDVGSLADFACLVFPASCNIVPKACNPPVSWIVNNNTCVPNTGAEPSPSGSTVTYIDTAGTFQGSATYACNDGTLSLKSAAICEPPPPLACNTAALSWTVAGRTCTPNTGSPTQIASGTSQTFQSSQGNVGSATYACSNGVLTQTGAPSCSPPVSSGCEPRILSWTVNGNTCTSDTVLEHIEGGGLFTFYDQTGLPTGYAAYSCFQNNLVPTGDQTCDPYERILDSFGGDGGAGDGSASGDGTAGDGKPIVGGRVRVVDATGKVALATTNSMGYFRVNLTGFVAPMVIGVTRADGVVRRAPITRSPVPNRYIFIAVTGLTDKIASDVARANGATGAASLTPQMIAQRPQAVTDAVNAIRNDAMLRSLIIEAGLSPDTFDPLGTPFRADGTGHDRVLDNVVVTVDASGATVVTPLICNVPASWTVGKDTCVPDRGSQSTIPNGSSLTLRDTQAPTTGLVTYTCTQGKVVLHSAPTCTSEGTASGPSN